MRANELLSEAFMKMFETSTSGGTSAGSVATVVGGLGAGFDPNADHGIYQKSDKKKTKKSTVVRR